MTENEFRILRHIAAGNAVSHSQLDPEDQLAFRCLRRKKFILDHEWFTGAVSITDAGRAALAAEEQRLEDQRKQRAYDDLRRDEERFYQNQQTQKHFRHDWRIAFFTTFAGFVLGVALEHRFDIVRNAVRLWLSLFQ